MRFSASRLKTFMECQQKAKFQYVDLLPRGPQNAKASFGTVMHHCLQQFAKTNNLELAKKTFLDLWENPEKLGVAPEVWPKMTTYGGLRERGLSVLDGLAGVLKWEERQVIATEHEFVVPFGEHELHGFVDLLDTRKSGKGKGLLAVTDYKTNAKRPNMAELALDPQFTVYSYASQQPEFWIGIPNGAELFERFNNTPRRNIWFQLWDAIEIDAGSRDDADFAQLYRVCEAIQKAYDNDVFVPQIGQACLFCPYTQPCGDFHVPTKEELREQEDAWI